MDVDLLEAGVPLLADEVSVSGFPSEEDTDFVELGVDATGVVVDSFDDGVVVEVVFAGVVVGSATKEAVRFSWFLYCFPERLIVETVGVIPEEETTES